MNLQADRQTDGATAKKGAYSVSALARGISILNAFTVNKPSLTLKEVVAATGLPKTTVFRLLATLIESDFIMLDERSGEYVLGFAVLRLGDIRRRQTDIHATLLPIMRAIREEINETVVFSIRAGDERIHIDSVESRQLVRRTAELGARAPLHAGASSKALLAGMTDPEITAYFARLMAGEAPVLTAPKVEDLWQEIARIRRHGFAESRGEVRPGGGGALATPIRNHAGLCVGALDILTPEERYTPDYRDRIVAVLLDGGRRASELLGYRG